MFERILIENPLFDSPVEKSFEEGCFTVASGGALASAPENLASFDGGLVGDSCDLLESSVLKALAPHFGHSFHVWPSFESLKLGITRADELLKEEGLIRAIFGGFLEALYDSSGLGLAFLIESSSIGLGADLFPPFLAVVVMVTNPPNTRVFWALKEATVFLVFSSHLVTLFLDVLSFFGSADGS